MLAILLLMEIIIILVSGILIIYIKDRVLRKRIVFWIILSSLITNTFSLFMAFFMHVQIYEVYLILDSNVLLIIESILVGGIIYATISKNNDKNSIKIPIYDGINQLILAGIIGFVSS
ncbi:MAG: hypothetical protein MUP85_08945, partial [Candidatus Lokiarchaeota archaeon]|nr:hypothetical protein [Candidatus Lokiarchaeota archaeon]